MRKHWVVTALVLSVLLVTRGNALTKPSATVEQRPAQQSVIDIAFCLDTTGSMSGLLEGAKTKIWSIVNTISTAKPRPTLRIALIGYRDLNDAYVTRVYDFTTNLEAMYGNLRDFQAQGGGDEPEHVNQALHESIHKLNWSKNSAALKILYLVGDAPPHLDYQDGFDYKRVSRRAAATGIIINTIQCGNTQSTQLVWQEIARMAEGKYAAIDQSGGVVHIASPFDAELAKLSGELNKTYVAYGSRGQANMASQRENDVAAEAAPAAAADRATAKASILYRNDSWDLVDAMKEDEKMLDKISKDQLPAELRSLPREEQKKILKVKEQERTRLQLQIQTLSKKRQDFVDNEKKKTGSKKDAFDAQVLSTLKEQGKNKGITFE